MSDNNTRARLYKIDDEDLENEIAKEGDSPLKAAPTVKDFTDANKEEGVDDLISRLQRKGGKKVEGENDKSKSVLQPKDIILELEKNQSNESISKHSSSFNKNSDDEDMGN